MRVKYFIDIGKNYCSMKTRHVISISFLFFILSTVTQAQKNLHPGYVVLTNNDTLRGLIDYKEWHRNPSAILFSSSPGLDAKKYTLNDLIYFEVSGKESYRRYVVRISLSTELLSNLTTKDTTTKAEAVFLKVIQKGQNVDLFSYTDEVKFRWYIKKSDETTPHELLNSIYRNNRGIINAREYRSQLQKISASYLISNSEIESLITNNDHSKKAMLDICYRINGLNELEVHEARVKLKKESPFRFFVGTGINIGSLTFSGNSHYNGYNSSPSYMPLVNGGVDIYFRPLVGKLYLRNSLIVTAFKAEATSPTETYFEASETYYFKMSQFNIALHLQLHYNLYNGKDFKWFVGAGGGSNFSFYPVNQQTFVREGLNAVTTVDDSSVPTKKFWLNASLRSGVSVKNWELSMNYFGRSSISQYTGSSLDNSSIQLQVIFLFKRKKTV